MIKRLILFVCLASTAQAQKFDGLALTPPMGWNSWNKFRCNVTESLIRETADAMAVSARLLDEGVFVTGFGFPVVPEGTARVRVQMSAALEQEHLDRALAAFERVKPE